ncbi:MAG: hypothetical protein LBR19_07265 [Bifidobacteriaceae bacterium]|jgi:serpin B|nr:hypothetical protein [Bifidobacteriaceae bacterium]
MKRQLASLLTAALMVGAVAACGGGSGAGTDQAGSATVTTEPAPAPSLTSTPLDVPLLDGVDPVAWLGERLFPLMAEAETDAVNPVYSPLSIYLAFALLSDGARGETAAQLAQALGGDAASAKELANAIMTDYAKYAAGQEAGEGCQVTLEGSDGAGEAVDPWSAECTVTQDPPVLNLANSLWADEAITLDQAFLADATDAYRAEVNNLDLQGDQAVPEINAWVTDKTNGLIDQAVTQDDFNASTRLVLVNALYFNSAWFQPFWADQTTESPFTLASGEVIQVPTMHRDDRGPVRYIQQDDGTVGALLPYTGGGGDIIGRFGLLLVLPAGGVDSVTWDGTQVKGWLGAMQEGDYIVNLDLPKWQADSGQADLIPVFQALGVTDLFDKNTANLTGVGQADGRLWCSRAAHQAVITVDEEGTEAAAVTLLIEEIVSMPQVFTVTLDRPFVYAIVDTETERPLFIGVVNDPRS